MFEKKKQPWKPQLINQRTELVPLVARFLPWSFVIFDFYQKKT